MTIIKNAVILIILICSFQVSYAQNSKIKTTSGEAQIRLEQNKTKEEAYREVEQLAKTKAIEKAFGTYVGQESNLKVESGKSKFSIIGTTKVKGEWIETLDKPKFIEESREVKSETGIQQELWITCKIRGKVKEATPKANIEAYTLSYPNAVSKSNTFKSGDDMFLYFKSPVDGYLSIYLDDDKNISKLFPYHKMDSVSCIPIVADKEYILFSDVSDHQYFKTYDKVKLKTPLKSEINTIHIFFSEKKYFKPGLTKAEEKENTFFYPKSLSRQQFADWLAETKATIDDFVDYQIKIEILGEE